MSLKALSVILVFSTVQILAQPSNQVKSDPAWKQYTEAGAARGENITGGFGYYRLNRRTATSFHDLRLFAYGLQDNTFIYLRFKNSQKYQTLTKLYRFTTLAYRKNTRTGVGLQYQYNQGLGAFLMQYGSGHTTAEIGLAYDMSDYLNDTHKTSYLKGGAYWDHDQRRFATKLEVEYFYQISDLNVTDLTRAQILAEVILPLKNGFSLNINFESENYFSANEQDANSINIALGWQGSLSWKY
ncbi:MAG: hypothetical protein ACE5D2_05820 [Fidelibacterota bacterium]